MSRHTHKKDEPLPSRSQFNYTLHLLPAGAQLESLDKAAVQEERDLFFKHAHACPRDIQRFADAYRRNFNTVIRYLDLLETDLHAASSRTAQEYAVQAWNALQAGFEPEKARDEAIAAKLAAKGRA